MSLLCFCILSVWLTTAAEGQQDPVSYARDIKPIFQAHCFGCHQPAKASGNYDMTSFDALCAGGDRGEVAIVPGNADGSLLLQLVVPVDGAAEMPMDGQPLHTEEIALIKRWIVEGAKNDTSDSGRPAIDANHPPVYTQPPVVTSLDYSPDGSMLAIAGSHEVLLHRPDGSGLVGRLIGLSERIEQVRFSPDGERLAAVGGDPARSGEVQIWNVANQVLEKSLSIGFDTLRGVSWSPDGKQIAFGSTDNIVRAIDADTGEQVLYQSAPADWPLDTVYSVDGSHLVAVGRDMTAKLIEVETERFIDNITSITPGALKGGLNSIARHPQRDEVLVGGADGVPRIYRMHRQTKRVIGDDANLLYELPVLEGRIFSVDISLDGTLFAAGSSLDGRGAVHVYRMAAEPVVQDDIAQLLVKPTHERSSEETAKLKQHFATAVETIASIPVANGSIYAVSISPNGKWVAASGSEGRVLLIDTEKRVIASEFDVVEVENPKPNKQLVIDEIPSKPLAEVKPLEEGALQDGIAIESLSVEPTNAVLEGPYAYLQIVVTAETADGRRFDVTRRATMNVSEPIASISPLGMLRSNSLGTSTLSIRFGELSAEVPVLVSGGTRTHADYLQDVSPILARAGCNAGTCHGAQDGQNGFKLSLRGYDAIFDVRALTDDHASRRVNLAAPERSLMLLKATAQVPHEGGQAIDPDAHYYQLIRSWIEGGAKLQRKSPEVVAVTVVPTNPVVEQLGSLQQLRVVASYSDGSSRDVTAEAFVESGNTDVVKQVADHPGLMQGVRRGESAVLVRYEGAYAATTLTVMGDRAGFEWQTPPANNRIDELVFAKLVRTKTLPSPVANDYEFVRRAYLDLTGLPPTPDVVREFAADSRDTRQKREELVDRLIGSDPFIDYWTNKWADLLQVNSKFLGREGATAFRSWIRQEVANNTPYDEFASKILTATGSNRDHPEASYFKILRAPEDTMENTTHLFLATRFNCNKCHDHPFERWTQDQYYELAAFFAKVQLERDPASGDQTIGATAVEAGKPLYETVSDGGDQEVRHDRTGEPTAPAFPFACEHDEPEDATRRRRLANWITSPDNPYFARSYVNRIWGYLLGVGIIEPIDDIRAGNPPSNPELLDYLTEEFIAHNFDVRHVMRLICCSRTYQQSVATNEWNSDDKLNFSHATARRLPAEVLFDAVYQVTGSTSSFPGVPPGTRAAALPDASINLPDGFLQTLGRPARESACECERVSEVQLGPVMALVSGPTVGTAISDPSNQIARLAASDLSDSELVEAIYLRIINRPPSPSEVQDALALMQEIQIDHDRLVQKRADYVDELAPELARREVDRQQQVIRLEASIESRRVVVEAERKRLDDERSKSIASIEAQLKAVDEAISQGEIDWEGELRSQFNRWTPLDISSMETTIPGKLISETDGSLYADVQEGKGDYRIAGTASTPRITAVRVQVLPDGRLPGNGPGRGRGNGNFVLSEISAAVVKGSDSSKTEVPFSAARADFSQGGYEVTTAIDGQTPESDNGWAISPELSKPHVAVFEFASPIELEEGDQIEFRLQQLYLDQTHSLGRFRISVTGDSESADFGLPSEVENLLAIEASGRTTEVTSRLIEYWKSQNSEFQELKLALAEAQKPIPEDAQFLELQSHLMKANKPLPIDARLRQFEYDIQLSGEQLKQLRITTAQDLTWALINSPAFLYNH